MKIAALCGHGLGSSFMVEMNIKSTLQELNLAEENFELIHSDMSSASPEMADLFFVGADLADSLSNFQNVIVLNSIIDKEELKEKLTKYLAQKGFIS